MDAYNTDPLIIENASTWREETRDGKKFLVVNGVAVVEGVLKNYLVPFSEFGAFAPDWNDVPLVIRHPKQNGGSARTTNPDVPVVGRFYNAKLDQAGKRLVGEFWLDQGELLKTPEGKTIANSIKAGKRIEVSTGYFAAIEQAPGQHNGVNYVGIHRSLHPDHIAILPDQLGACSIVNGCGLNRNDADSPEICLNACPCKKDGAMSVFNAETIVHLKGEPQSLTQQLSDIRDAFMTAAKAGTPMGSEPPGYWLREIFTDHVIVETSKGLMKASYSIDGGKYTFDNANQWEPVKVKVSYVANMVGNAPDKMKRMFEQVYQSARDNGDDEETASKKAYGACKKSGWHKKGDTWVHNDAALGAEELEILYTIANGGPGSGNWGHEGQGNGKVGGSGKSDKQSKAEVARRRAEQKVDYVRTSVGNENVAIRYIIEDGPDAAADIYWRNNLHVGVVGKTSSGKWEAVALLGDKPGKRNFELGEFDNERTAARAVFSKWFRESDWTRKRFMGYQKNDIGSGDQDPAAVSDVLSALASTIILQGVDR